MMMSPVGGVLSQITRDDGPLNVRVATWSLLDALEKDLLSAFKLSTPPSFADFKSVPLLRRDGRKINIDLQPKICESVSISLDCVVQPSTKGIFRWVEPFDIDHVGYFASRYIKVPPPPTTTFDFWGFLQGGEWVLGQVVYETQNLDDLWSLVRPTSLNVVPWEREALCLTGRARPVVIEKVFREFMTAARERAEHNANLLRGIEGNSVQAGNYLALFARLEPTDPR